MPASQQMQPHGQPSLAAGVFAGRLVAGRAALLPQPEAAQSHGQQPGLQLPVAQQSTQPQQAPTFGWASTGPNPVHVRRAVNAMWKKRADIGCLQIRIAFRFVCQTRYVRQEGGIALRAAHGLTQPDALEDVKGWRGSDERRRPSRPQVCIDGRHGGREGQEGDHRR